MKWILRWYANKENIQKFLKIYAQLNDGNINRLLNKSAFKHQVEWIYSSLLLEWWFKVIFIQMLMIPGRVLMSIIRIKDYELKKFLSAISSER